MKTITDKYIRSLFNSISSELTELVQEAEKMPYTTKNNYGQYLKLLTMLKPLNGLNNAVKLLILAGGNKQGILDAKEILK